MESVYFLCKNTIKFGALKIYIIDLLLIYNIDSPTLIKIKISFSFGMQSWIIHLWSDPDGHWIKDQIIPDNLTADQIIGEIFRLAKRCSKTPKHRLSGIQIKVGGKKHIRKIFFSYFCYFFKTTFDVVCFNIWNLTT